MATVIPAAAQAPPLPSVPIGVPVAQSNGSATISHSKQQTQLTQFVTGMGRIIPCSSAGTNLITLTPNKVSPQLFSGGYVFGDAFAFWAAASSTSSVTMTVVPPNGTMPTLKAYKTNGSAQAGNGDVTAGLFYVAFFVPSLDGAVGGFVLK